MTVASKTVTHVVTSREVVHNFSAMTAQERQVWIDKVLVYATEPDGSVEKQRIASSLL